MNTNTSYKSALTQVKTSFYTLKEENYDDWHMAARYYTALISFIIQCTCQPWYKILIIITSVPLLQLRTNLITIMVLSTCGCNMWWERGVYWQRALHHNVHNPYYQKFSVHNPYYQKFSLLCLALHSQEQNTKSILKFCAKHKYKNCVKMYYNIIVN